MRIALLHTAEIHVATFDQIFDDLNADLRLDHRVDASLLARARQNGLDAVRADVRAILDDLGDADAVLCTCSTLGPLIDEATRISGNIIRIDRPLMEHACADGNRILVALCLDSTRRATLDLLSDCAEKAGRNAQVVVVLCDAAWAFFEAGDIAAYGQSIAGSIKSKLSEGHEVDSIVLAQASMRVAEAELADIGIPVHSSPAIAAKVCLNLAQARRM